MSRPNILILTTDQQRWTALGENGNPEISTPNLDRLARMGTNFSNCHVQNPVCMPSRISFLTGLYPSTLGITHMGVPVPEETETLPRMLKSYGYRSANFGKLHFLPHANRDHREPHPDYGFDQLEVSDEPGVYDDAYRAWVRSKDPSLLDLLSPGLPPATSEWKRIMDEQDEVVHPSAKGRDDFDGYRAFPGEDGLTHSAFVADRTIDFLAAQRDRPFLCVSAFYSPHAPWVVPKRFLDLYEEESLGLPQHPGGEGESQLRRARLGYYAAVSEVDFHVGRILDALESHGQLENTIIVFTSDHGEWLGEFGRWGKGYPGNDPVSRVPLLIRVPGMAENQHCDSIVESLDVIPTLLEQAGIPVMPRLQGSSLSTALGGEGFSGKGSALMEFSGWKNLRTEHFRYLLHEDGRECLWNLDLDPGEAKDVSTLPEFASDLTEHRKLLAQRLIQIERPLRRSWPY